MKILYSLLVTVCALTTMQALDANHDKPADKHFHFGPVPGEDEDAKKLGDDQ